jgi:hypothetical protein
MCLSYWNTKISQGIISVSVHSGHFSFVKVLFPSIPWKPSVQGGKKLGRRKFWFPRVRIVAELSKVVWWLNSHIRIIHQSNGHKRREK